MNAQETGESEYIDAVGEYESQKKVFTCKAKKIINNFFVFTFFCRLAHLALRRLLNPILHNEFIFNLTSTGKRAKKVLKTLHDFTDKVNENLLNLFASFLFCWKNIFFFIL